MTDIFAKEYCRHGDDARPTLRGGEGLVCELCGGKIPEKKGDEARESCSTMPQSERVRRVTRAKRKLLQGRAMIDEALRELEELEAA